jgi:hypothetical protein
MIYCICGMKVSCKFYSSLKRMQAKVFMDENMSKQAIIKAGEGVVVLSTSIGRT